MEFKDYQMFTNCVRVVLTVCASAVALSPQVTKLCDLAPGDSVCSVSWSQRGTYLSVGTNTGEVQVGPQQTMADSGSCVV